MDTKQDTRKNPATLILIGHGAYQGANRPATAHSKAQAVRILRLRGVLRNEARKVVDAACSSRDGYCIARTETCDLVEVNNVAARAICEEWPSLNYSRSQKLRWGEMA